MKIHKNIFYAALASLVFSQTSCTKNFLDYNTNPTNATKEEMGRDAYAFSSALTGLQAWVVPLDVNSNQFVECLLGGSFGGYLSDSNNGFNGKNFATYNPDNGWARVPFKDIIPNIITRHSKIRSITNDPVAHAVGDIVKVISLVRITDIYGPIPYSQIGQDGKLEAPYDSQEDVYNKMFDELNQAIAVLTENRTQNFSANADQVFKGNVMKWIKLANSMKLRMAIRISNVNAAKAKEMAESAVAHEVGVMSSNDDNAFVDPINKNPFRVIMYEYNNGDSRVSADITSYMNGYVDPRREKYFVPSTFTTASNGFVGMRSGINIPSGSTIKQYANMNVQETSKVMWMNAAEVAFLRAEGATKGWNMGGTAENFYNSGIRLSFEQWGASGADGYLANATNRPASYIDPVSPSFSFAGTPSSITIKWDESADLNTKLERIITQKWIANFPLGIEAWSEYRRTGFPKLMSVMVNNSAGRVSTNAMARRLAYPQEEYTENNTNVLQAVSGLLGGADNMGTDVRWAKK